MATQRKGDKVSTHPNEWEDERELDDWTIPVKCPKCGKGVRMAKDEEGFRHSKRFRGRNGGLHICRKDVSK